MTGLAQSTALLIVACLSDLTQCPDSHILIADSVKQHACSQALPQTAGARAAALMISRARHRDPFHAADESGAADFDDTDAAGDCDSRDAG